MIDLCMRLLSNMGLSVQDHCDAIRKLRERDMIEKEEEELLLRMVGFRNIVVHGYAEIDLNTVDRIIREREYRKILRIAQNLRDRARQYWDPTPM